MSALSRTRMPQATYTLRVALPPAAGSMNIRANGHWLTLPGQREPITWISLGKEPVYLDFELPAEPEAAQRGTEMRQSLRLADEEAPEKAITYYLRADPARRPCTPGAKP